VHLDAAWLRRNSTRKTRPLRRKQCSVEFPTEAVALRAHRGAVGAWKARLAHAHGETWRKQGWLGCRKQLHVRRQADKYLDS